MTHEILLVEDSTAQAAVYRSYLESEGHFVHAVDSGEAALEYMSRHKPAAILLDLQLPGIQGLDVMTRLQELRCSVPVVVISDHGSTDNVVDAMRLGAVDFVTKPFGRSRLAVTVGNAIRQRELSAMVETYRGQFAREKFHGFIGGSLAHAGPVPHHRQCCAEPRDGLHHRRERHRQGARAPRAIHRQSRRADRPVHRGQLRRVSRAT